MSLKNIGLIPGDVLISSNGQRLEIAENHKSYVTITHSLRYEIPTGCALMKLDWQLKFANQKNTLQFIGMAFKDKYIYLSNDTGPKLNPERAVVFRARDDGTDSIATPEPVLKAEHDQEWGCFILECDSKGNLWTALRPVSGKGAVYMSRDGENWEKVVEASTEDLPCWRGTHTFRDATLGQTGYGRNLHGTQDGIITAFLNGSINLV